MTAKTNPQRNFFFLEHFVHHPPYGSPIPGFLAELWPFENTLLETGLWPYLSRFWAKKIKNQD